MHGHISSYQIILRSSVRQVQIQEHWISKERHPIINICFRIKENQKLGTPNRRQLLTQIFRHTEAPQVKVNIKLDLQATENDKIIAFRQKSTFWREFVRSMKKQQFIHTMIYISCASRLLELCIGSALTIVCILLEGNWGIDHKHLRQHRK